VGLSANFPSHRRLEVAELLSRQYFRKPTDEQQHSRASHRFAGRVLLVSLDNEDGFIVNTVLLAISAQLVISF
jgi:hypothetical protein